MGGSGREGEGVGRVGGQGGCEWVSDAFVKIKKKNYYYFFFFWGGGESGRGRRMGGGGGGVRVDVNGEVKFL